MFLLRDSLAEPRTLSEVCMRNFVSLLAVALFAVAVMQGQANSSAVPKQMQSFDLNAIDKSVDPCTDFYHYACGNWLKKNPIPPDQAAWGRFNELHERNQIILRNILDKQSANNRRSQLQRPEDRRLLLLLHGRVRHRVEGTEASSAYVGSHRGAEREVPTTCPDRRSA